MKKLIFMVCFLGVWMISPAQDFVKDFLNKQRNPEQFTEVNIGKELFRLAFGQADKDMGDILRNLDQMRVLSSERNAGKYAEEAKLLIGKNSAYKQLMCVKEEGEEVYMYTRESKGDVAELVILVFEKEEFTLINFLGKINLNEISGLANGLNVSGAEQLKRINDKQETKKGEKAK